MPYDPELAEAMRRALRRRRNVVEKKMFGGYCWMLNGNMLCGVEVGRYMFRVGKVLEAEALSRPGAGPMDITGKPMAGFVWVDARQADASGLDHWIALAAQYVGSLPAK
jgi:TfoX/Sxy family transcriptional regulator of competence genes